MSRLYETLRRMEREHSRRSPTSGDSDQPIDMLRRAVSEPDRLQDSPCAIPKAGPRLVALSDDLSLGAEKFRALVNKLENIRQKRELKSLQVTSAVISEGKTLTAANLASTLAKHGEYRVLAVEGDLHRPMLSSLFGLKGLQGLSHWWKARGEQDDIFRYIWKLDDMPLWLLGAGQPFEHPSQLLQSARFAETFARLCSLFDWVVVDSTPMLPVIDTNLWTRLVDGTLLVVREGVTPAKALKKGVDSLDNPKWLGIVLNEAAEFDRIHYNDQY